jgi:hypothetical protein
MSKVAPNGALVASLHAFIIHIRSSSLIKRSPNTLVVS